MQTSPRTKTVVKSMSNAHAPFYKNAIWQYGLQVVKYLFPLATLPYLTRVLEPTGYAFYAYLVSFMSFVQVFIDFGFNLSGTKKIARAESVEAENRVIGAVTEARVVLCIVASAVAMGAASVLPITKTNLPYVFLAFIAVCGKGLVPDFLFQGHEDMGPITIRFLVSKSISTVLTFVLVSSSADIMWIPLLDIVSNGIALVWSFAAARNRFGTSITIVPLREALSELKTSGLYCFSNMAASVFSGFTTLLIGVVVTDTAQISYWSLSMTAVTAVQALYEPIINSLYPHMVNTGDYHFAKRLSLLALPCVAVGTAAFCILSKHIMLVLGGEQYLAGSWVLVWVSPLLVFSFFGMLLGWPVLGSAGKVAEVTHSTVVSAIFCIVSLLLVSVLGMANMHLICVIRCITEALMLGLRLHYAMPILKDKASVNGHMDELKDESV